MLTADCGPPPDFEAAIEIYEDTVFGSTVVFLSRRGFAFNGSEIMMEATCGESGSWFGPPEDEPAGNPCPCQGHFIESLLAKWLGRQRLRDMTCPVHDMKNRV